MFANNENIMMNGLSIYLFIFIHWKQYHKKKLLLIQNANITYRGNRNWWQLKFFTNDRKAKIRMHNMNLFFILSIFGAGYSLQIKSWTTQLYIMIYFIIVKEHDICRQTGLSCTIRSARFWAKRSLCYITLLKLWKCCYFLIDSRERYCIYRKTSFRGAYGHDYFGIHVFEEHRLDSTPTDITTALIIS